VGARDVIIEKLALLRWQRRDFLFAPLEGGSVTLKGDIETPASAMAGGVKVAQSGSMARDTAKRAGIDVVAVGLLLRD